MIILLILSFVMLQIHSFCWCFVLLSCISIHSFYCFFFFKQKTAYEILALTGVQTCALPILEERAVPLAPGLPGGSDALACFPAWVFAGGGIRWEFSLVDKVGVEDHPVAEEVVPVQIGRASCRERVEISVVAVSLKKKRE